MQIFSKLQRNSSYQIFIIVIFAYLINLFSSFSPFFPLLFGVFILCNGFFEGIFFIIFFSLFHNLNVYVLFMFYLFFKMYAVSKFIYFIDLHYQKTVMVMFIYIFLAIFLYLSTDVNLQMLFIYIIYNLGFDLIVLRLIKCELK